MQNALSNEQLQRVAPSIFATQPWGEVSDKYSFVPTIGVVDEMRSAGFMPVKAMQSRSRIADKREFTKHVIRFRHQDYLQRAVGDELPEIVLVNSHDRSSGFQLSAGVFRLVCSNGMVVKSASFDDISVRHSGDVAGLVVEGSARIIDQMPEIMDNMQRMKGIVLSQPERELYAKAALELRYPSSDDNSAPIVPGSLLHVRRFEDRKDDLWTTFNVVQENFIRGGVRGRSVSGRRMSTRPIASVSEDIRLNKALWVLTEKLRELKEGA